MVTWGEKELTDMDGDGEERAGSKETQEWTVDTEICFLRLGHVTWHVLCLYEELPPSWSGSVFEDYWLLSENIKYLLVFNLLGKKYFVYNMYRKIEILIATKIQIDKGTTL